MSVTTQKRKYLELADYLRERIRKGELKVGDRLPTYAELYDELGASTATVQRACDLLHREQLIDRRHGSGVFVADRRLRSKLGTIGIVGSVGFNAQEKPFYIHLMRAVHRAVESQGRQLMYLGTETAWYLSPNVQVDGVLICAVEETSPIAWELPRHVPRVSLLTSLEGVVSVGVDEYRGAQVAVRHLMDMGHRRIACLMEKHAWEVRRRVAGYEDALRERGIEPEPSWKRLVQLVDRNSPQPYREWAHDQMRDWLRDGWDETGCTAILVQNDTAALAAMQVLQKAEIDVPRQVSVMGFDGTEICDLITPRLSAVAFPFSEIGAATIEALNRQIDGKCNSAQTITLPVSLRHGESVAENLALSECQAY